MVRALTCAWLAVFRLLPPEKGYTPFVPGARLPGRAWLDVFRNWLARNWLAPSPVHGFSNLVSSLLFLVTRLLYLVRSRLHVVTRRL